MGSVTNKLLQALLALGTMMNYESVMKDIHYFCNSFHYDFKQPSEQCIFHFLLKLEYEKKSFSCCVKVKLALELHGHWTVIREKDLVYGL